MVMRTLRNMAGLLVLATAPLPGCSTLEMSREDVGPITARAGVDLVCAAANLVPIPGAALGVGVLAKGVHAAAGLVQQHFEQRRQQSPSVEVVAQRAPAQLVNDAAPLPPSVIQSVDVPGP
jgi:hypothetical protein